MCFVAKRSAPAVPSVNDCTGSDFETSRIARTGNEKSSSIAVRAYGTPFVTKLLSWC